MPDLTSLAELEYITWKGITIHIVNKNFNEMLWVVLSWVEIGGLMKSISKARHLKPSIIYYVSKPYNRHTHIFLLETPPSPSRVFFIKKIEDERWLAGFSSTTMPGPSWGLWAHPAGPGHFACNSLSMSFAVSSSHVDVQVFAPSTALVISWTRDCRSSDLITGEMLLSVCSATISLPQTSFGCFKPGVTRMGGMFRDRGSWSMCWKAAISRWPLRGTTTKKKLINFNFSQW